MAKDNFSRILVKTSGQTKRLCSLHLNLPKKDLYIEFKTFSGKPFQISQSGIGGINYRTGSFTVKNKTSEIGGVSHVHYLIETNEVLFTLRTKNARSEHLPKVKLTDKKIVRFFSLIPHWDSFPNFIKQKGHLDFTFEPGRLFGNKPLYIDFWFGKNLDEVEQGLIQGKLKTKYMSETGRICEIVGGATENFNIIIAFYQPRKAKPLPHTRLLLPTTVNPTLRA